MSDTVVHRSSSLIVTLLVVVSINSIREVKCVNYNKNIQIHVGKGFLLNMLKNSR